jgi:hypothetical protein
MITVGDQKMFGRVLRCDTIGLSESTSIVVEAAATVDVAFAY